MSQQEYEDTTKSKTRSRSPSPLKTSNNEILSLEKEVKDKEHELSIAYQTSLELIETNNELQQQFEEQCITIQTLDAHIVDYEMKIDLVEAENMEYQQTFLQTNEKYEQLLGELAVTREHLNNSKDEINEYQHTIQLLNHDIIHNTNDKKQAINSNNNNNEVHEMKEKLSKQQRKYDELLRDCERYRNEFQHLEDAQIEIENMKNSQIKYEKRAKLLSDQIVELTYQNVQLEKEINDYNSDINQQNQTIQYLQTENQKLMTQKLINNHNMNNINNTPHEQEPNKLAIGAKKRLYSSYGGPESVLSTFVNNNISENNDLKRRLSVQLRDNFGYNSKLVMFANNIDENQAINPNPNHNANEDCNDSVEEENDLFTMVQSYENNDEYLRNAEMEESLSDLSEKNTTNTQIVHEEKRSADSVSPKSNDPVLANKSRQEKAIDPKQRKSKKKSARNLSQRHKSSKKRHYPRKKAVYRKTDALDEYLHLTASAVKINYPTVNATSKELIEMVKSLPFYQAHDHLNRYMMDRLRWEQIQQNKLLQLKAAAIQSQRDHQMAQQSTVTRLFKKWFTTEYDDIHHIVANPRKHNKGRIDLSSPLSKKENLRLNRVGKAKMKQTESGGTSVNLGSLNPKGIPPKGTSKKKRIIHTSASKQKRGVRINMIDIDNANRKRKKRDKKLKSLAMTQTLPTERMNDKKVQKMLQINAEYIDKVMQNEVQKKQKNAKAVTIKLTVPTKPSNEKISNAEVAPSHGNKSIQDQKNAHPQRQPKQGWISWLTGAQQTQSASKERRRRDDVVRDPYALAANGGGRKEKKRRSNKRRKHSKARKSRSPQMKQKEKRRAMDVNENIKNVIAIAQNENDDEADEKMVNLGQVHIESKRKEIGIKNNEIAEDEKELNLEQDAVNDDDVNEEKEHVVIGGDKSEPVIADINDTQTGKILILEQKQMETDKVSDEIAMDVGTDDSELVQVCEANMNELDANNVNVKTQRNETDDVHNENGAVQSDEDVKSEHKIPDQKIESKSDDDIQLKSNEIMQDIDNMHDDDEDGINAAMSNMSSTFPSPMTSDANPSQAIAQKPINIADNEANDIDPYALSTDGIIESNLDDNSDDLDDILQPISPHRGAQVNVDHLQNNHHTHT